MAQLAAVAMIVSAAATVYAGVETNKAKKDQSRQLERQANERRAISQRAAREQRRRGEIIESRARAVAAASGASVTDPTMVRLIGDINAEAEYRAMGVLWSGYSEANTLEESARIARREGKAALVGSVLQGASTAMGGVASMRKAYTPSGSPVVPGDSSAKLEWNPNSAYVWE